MTSEVVTVHPEDDFEVALQPPGAKELFLPAGGLAPRDKVVVGILKIDDVLTAYNQRLLKDQTFRPSGPGPETSV